MTQSNGTEPSKPIASLIDELSQHGEAKTITSQASRSSEPPANDTVFFARMRRAGVGKRHAEFVMNQFTTPELRDTESDWYQKFQDEKVLLGTGFFDVLLGPRGRGKTALASMLIGCECWRNREPKYATAMQVMRDIRGDFEGGNTRRVYERTGLLVIDEYHRADTTDWSERVMEEVLDSRYRNRLDTVLISNDSPVDFAEHCGTSASSRIKGTGKIIVLEGTDYREGGEQ